MLAQLLKPGLSTCMGAATAAATSQAAAMLQYYLVLLAAEYQLAAPEVGGGGAAGGVLVRAEHRAEPVHAHPDHAAHMGRYNQCSIHLFCCRQNSFMSWVYQLRL